MSEKSIIDSVAIINKAFPTDVDYVGPVSPAGGDVSPSAKYTVVSACPHCGGPIYGERTKSSLVGRSGGNDTGVAFSCNCRHFIARALAPHEATGQTPVVERPKGLLEKMFTK